MIPWQDIAEELGISDSDDDMEGMVHEIAHAYDCIGEYAFDYVGKQKRVGALIANKYGNDVVSASKAEIRASAVTRLVLTTLGEMTEALACDIASSMFSNLAREWHGDTESEYEKALVDPEAIRQASAIAKFLVDFD